LVATPDISVLSGVLRGLAAIEIAVERVIRIKTILWNIRR
jgi:hypothetical protein